MFIAPTEPPKLKALGAVSMLPERHGVDVLWDSALGLCGVQRKVFPADFLASIHGKDDRLSREFPMMQSLQLRVLLLEGREFWTRNGDLVRDRGSNRWAWTRSQHRNYLASVSHMHGIMVAHTDDLDDTIEYLRGLQMWSDKASHDSLLRRSNPGADSPWGTTSSRAWSLHFLQGIDGLGPKVAAAILDYFGKLPFELSVTEAELLQVPGVGPKMARKIMETFK